ncbi:probable L-type lectin-domain containing receptor kinase S.7 [Aristolochia californica]|uniref:probable L-type lectin-domain containing receptor kinase S.7 n=1 Tax=Aristolochia californica TaxID=171875 RepID=UPI0035E0672E
MNPPPSTFLLLIFLLLAFSRLCLSSQPNIIFNFSSFSFRNLTLLGDSYLRNGAVGLTRELGVPSSSAGTVICNSPVRFFDPTTNSSASFSTQFSFSITNVNPDSYGDGLTFFLSASNQTLGSPGGYLGLFNSSYPFDKKILAVEFDTREDTLFNDPSSNHVGVDIGSLQSVETSEADSGAIDLKSGDLITAWIDYLSSQKVVQVWLSYSSFKPEKPLLSAKADLSKHFQEFMYVGFSASTEGSTEVHTIVDWSFLTFEFSSSNEQSKPHPSSNGTRNVVPVIPVLPASQSCHKQNKKLILGLGISGPIAVFLALAGFGWYTAKKWQKIKADSGIKPELLKGPRKFSYREIKAATKDFHGSRILGHGAFGTVYKAILPEPGLSFAVKRSKHTHQGKDEFLAELTIIACLRHRNLLHLQGWCAEKGELFLVYDFMPNGSLDEFLHQESGTTLTFAQRSNIAHGIASVLTYLHEECEQQVIHRDIKSSNILLDGNFNPRLGDFGLARLMDHDKSPVSTLTAGTMGYLAPEYLQSGKATEKTDVYSFGVVVLEVACGRMPIVKDGDSVVNLVDWVWGLYSADRLIEAVDPTLNGDFDKEEMTRLLILGLSCANPDCAARPSMRRALQILNREADLLVLPKKKPSLQFSVSLPVNIHDIVSEREANLASYQQR